MARLTALPAIDIIRGFKGTIDFYLWKGLPCARKWPYTPPSKRTAATKAAAALFGAVLSAYKLLAPLALAAYQESAAGIPRTARDIYVSGLYGRLHEASMSDFLTLLTECRDSLALLESILDALGSVDTDDLQVDVKTSALPAGAATLAEQQAQTAALQLIDDLRNALGSVNTDDLQVDVKTSALPAGAATLAEQETQTTALQLIDDLPAALASVATDQLQVRGKDQLFSIKGVLAKAASGNPSANNGFLSSPAVPAGEYWTVTTIAAGDATRALTRMLMMNIHDAVGYQINDDVRAFAPAESSTWTGFTFLDPGDKIYVYYYGSLAADTVYLELTGFRTTLET